MPLSLFDALLESAPQQSDGVTYSSYFDSSATPTPTQSSPLKLYPYSYLPSPTSHTPSPQSHTSASITTHLEQLDALDLARSTYWELLDWKNELAQQPPPRDRESLYLHQAEFKRVSAALVQQAELVKTLSRACAQSAPPSTSQYTR